MADMASNAEENGSTWTEFSQEVTMHGIRYTTLKTISIIRR